MTQPKVRLQPVHLTLYLTQEERDAIAWYLQKFPTRPDFILYLMGVLWDHLDKLKHEYHADQDHP